MFPLRDSTPRQRFPFVNYALILLNLYAFFLQLTSPSFETSVYQYGFIPSHFNFFDPTTYIAIFSSLFLHGGVFHILSNMWFLHIFGDNVEDRLGHFTYLGFYLMAGFAATMLQYVLTVQSTIPLIGASGAISGVAGAYYVFFRESRVQTLVFLFVIWTIIELRASIVLGYWFLTQLFAGVGSLASADVNQGGIAFFAHVGGFVFGYIMAKSASTKVV